MELNVLIKMCVPHIEQKLPVILVELMAFVYGMDICVHLCNHVQKQIRIKKHVYKQKIVVPLNMQLGFQAVHVMIILVNHIRDQMKIVIHFMIGINLIKEVAQLLMENVLKWIYQF